MHISQQQHYYYPVLGISTQGNAEEILGKTKFEEKNVAVKVKLQKNPLHLFLKRPSN